MSVRSTEDARGTEFSLPLEVVDRRPPQPQNGRRKSKWRWWLCLFPVAACGGLVAAVYPYAALSPYKDLSPYAAIAPDSWFPYAGRSQVADGRVAETSAADQVPRPLPVLALGRLEPEGEILSVAAPSGSGDARIERLMVREGQAVEKDQVLAVLDNQQRLEAARQVALDSLRQARARLARTQLDVETTSDQLQAALRAAEARLAVARAKLARSQRLLQQHAVSQEEFDERELEVATAEQTVREAASRRQRYVAGSQGETVDMALARADLAVAESSLRQADANLEQAFVRAPIQGTILQLNGRVGERVGQSALLEMGATGSMMARVEVYESDVSRIRLGQRATLTASPLPGSLAGTVERVANLVKRQEIVDADPAANTDARVLEAWVRLDAESSDQAARFVNLQVRVEFQP